MVLGLFGFFKQEEDSKTVAKERLKLVLVHDRANLSPQLLEDIKDDIVDVISKYVNIDENGLDIKLTRMKNKEDMTISALIASIPFINQDIK